VVDGFGSMVMSMVRTFQIPAISSDWVYSLTVPSTRPSAKQTTLPSSSHPSSPVDGRFCIARMITVPADWNLGVSVGSGAVTGGDELDFVLLVQWQWVNLGCSRRHGRLY
jgi:hypothetical protein